MKTTGLLVLLMIVFVQTGRCFLLDILNVFLHPSTQARVLKNIHSIFGNRCPKRYQQLIKEDLRRFENCLEQVDKNAETACSVFYNHFRRCSHPFFTTFEKCLPKKSKNIPELFLEMTEAVFSHLCKEDSHHLFEFLNGCFWKPNNVTAECVRSEVNFEQYKFRPPTKNNVCKEVQSLKLCLSNDLKDLCGNEITLQSWMRLFDVAIAVCEKSADK